MNAPFDPEETHDGSESEDRLDENSMTWGAADPDFDQMLRDRLGSPESMPTPPHAFERVLLAGRRRRARKVWAIGAAAALVVMVGTAGTTVALQGLPSNGVVGPAASGTQQRTAPSTPSSTASITPTPSVAASTPTPAASSTSATPTASTTTSAAVAQCHSDDLLLTVTAEPAKGSSGTLLIVLTNNSAHNCTTYGYPGLQTETQNEQLQTTTVGRNSAKVGHLTLTPGQSISALATFTTVAASATASPGAGCGAPSYYLAVIPPNEQTQIAATISGGPVTVCGSGTFASNPLVMGATGGQ